MGTAQKVLQRAISKKESVGESYRGFMSDVKEELEVRSTKLPRLVRKTLATPIREIYVIGSTTRNSGTRCCSLNFRMVSGRKKPVES